MGVGEMVSQTMSLEQVKKLLPMMQPAAAFEILGRYYIHLAGQPIRTGLAVQKYGVPRGTLESWEKRGYIRLIAKGKRGGGEYGQAQYDEGDIAVMCEMNKLFRRGAGGPIKDFRSPTVIAS